MCANRADRDDRAWHDTEGGTTMPARRLATAAAFVVAIALLGGSIILAQDPVEPEIVEPGVSPGPVGSPLPMSPLPMESLPPASPAAATPAASMSAATVVGVTLQEVAVVLETPTIPAGSVTLETTNAGPALEHELVVVRTDLAAEALPTNEDGSFNEAGEGVEILGEIEPFAVGTTESLTLDLPAGHYVFLCNVVDTSGDAPFSHYAAGMRVDVEVVDAAMSPAPMGSPPASPTMSPVPMSLPSAVPESPAT
jgi:hypothetical protein